MKGIHGLWAALVGCAVISAGCGGGVECGIGTFEVDGECVPSDSNNSDNNTNGNNTTGNNTTGNNTTPQIECGTGTVLEDGACVVEEPTTCGEGTERDANTGECVLTDAVCADGTAFDMNLGACLPTDMVCAAGTTFDAAMGVCLPDAQCSPGDEIVNGFCLSPVASLIASADLEESENNDVDLGGTANTVTLPAAGARFVATGAIGTPVDLDGDGVADQDVDVFEFSATAGQWVTVAVQEQSGPALTYRVSGPNGFMRYTDGPVREFVTSQDGTYQVVVSPLAAGSVAPLGDDDSAYALTFEVNDGPQATAADMLNGVPFDARDLRANLFTDASSFAAGDVAQLALLDTSLVEVIYFDGGTVVGSAPARRLTNGGMAPVTPYELPASGELTVLVDWVSPDQPADSLLVASNGGQLNDLGTLTSGASASGTVATLSGVAIFEVEVPAGHALEISQTNDEAARVDWSIHGGGSIVTGFLDAVGPSPFATQYGYAGFSLEGGTYLIQVSSQAGAVLTNLEVTAKALVANDIGTLAAGDTFTDARSTAMGPGESTFYRVELSEHSVLLGSLTTPSGFADIVVYDEQGNRVVQGAVFSETLVQLSLPAGQYVLDVGSFLQPLPGGFTLDFTANALGATQEQEPNNARYGASPGLAVGEAVSGRLPTGDVDWLSFTVASSDIYTVGAFATTGGTASFQIAVANAAGEVIKRFASNFLPADNAVISFLEPGDYTASIRTSGSLEYVATMSQESSPADVNDAGGNDDAASAQSAAPAAGYTIAGVLSGSTDEDWYTFDLTDATTFSAVTSGGTLTFYDAAMAPIAVNGDLVDLPAGTSYMSVTGFVDGGATNDYLVEFEVPLPNMFESTVSTLIPDAGAPTDVVADTIAVADSCTISEIEIGVDITHPNIADLRVVLTSAAGTSVTLKGPFPPAFGADLVGTYPTTLTPMMPLDSLIGEDAAGDWVLSVGDANQGGFGFFNSWTLAYDCQ